MAIKRKISEERKQQLRDQLERARAKRNLLSTRMYILQFLISQMITTIPSRL